MNIDKYLYKTFKQGKYNCWDFAREVWLELTGTDLGAQTPEDSSFTSYNDRALQVANTLTESQKPKEPCLVLLQRSRLEPHIAVYHRGKVLHLTKRGAYYMSLDQLTPGYTSVRYYS